MAGTVLASFLFLPLPAVLPQPKLVVESLPTHVHLLDGTEIAVFKDVDLKIEIQPSDIPEVLKQAVVSVEEAAGEVAVDVGDGGSAGSCTGGTAFWISGTA